MLGWEARWGSAVRLILQIVDLIFHPVTFALDEHRFGVVQEAVEQCRGERAVVVEDFGPVLKHAIGCNDCRTAFIARADDLKEAVGAEFVDGEIAELVNY